MLFQAAEMPTRRPAPPEQADPREALVRQHLRPVWRFLRLLGCASADADDLTQETFVIAFRKGLGDRNEAEVASFLRQTARNLFLQNLERGNRRDRAFATLAEQLASQQRPGADDEAIAALQHCIEQLPERSQSLVRAFYGEGRSRAEIATVNGMQETGIKTALQRLRQTLRTCLEDSQR